MQKVVVITGPTAVGKTKCSLAVAKHFQTDIINGDAYQVYQKMNIGTAKPTLDEMGQINHHLIDFIAPQTAFSVADYQKLVREEIEVCKKENRLPLIVGGSGLYIESVICNYEFSEANRNTDFEKQFIDYSNEELHAYLAKLNPAKGAEIHPNNRKRVLRAIEICLENETPKQNHKDEMMYDALVLFLNDDREVLYNRINDRVDQMFELGLEQEVRTLYDQNELGPTSKVAIGYKEMIDYFEGRLTKQEAMDKIKQASRNYAKRQLTWFRNKSYVTIVHIQPDNFDQTIQQVENLIQDFINQ